LFLLQVGVMNCFDTCHPLLGANFSYDWLG